MEINKTNTDFNSMEKMKKCPQIFLPPSCLGERCQTKTILLLKILQHVQCH